LHREVEGIVSVSFYLQILGQFTLFSSSFF
jgi:hypothetical protein